MGYTDKDIFSPLAPYILERIHSHKELLCNSASPQLWGWWGVPHSVPLLQLAFPYPFSFSSF